jgi:hypothetical protein
VAQLLIGCLLFAQLAVAAYACPSVPSMGGQIPMVGSNCEDMAMRALDPQNANLCAEHCKFGQQSDQTSTLTVPAVVLMALYFTPLVPAPMAELRPAAGSQSALVTASPPHTILHCCFRI